jgi:hypothetical protein
MQSTLMLVVAACWWALPAVGAPKQKSPQGFKAIHWQWQPCRWNLTCDDSEYHGEIFVELRNGRRIRVASQIAFAHAHEQKQPRLSPDKRTAAWLEGEQHLQHSNNVRYLPMTKLVLLRDAQARRAKALIIRGQKSVIEDWFFWNDGKQIALLSRQLHGPAVCELHDSRSGKLLNTWPGPRAHETGAPQWAKRLGG